MNGTARFYFAAAAFGAQCALGAAMATTTSLDEYLYPATVPPDIAARFIYRIELTSIYEQGSGSFRTEVGRYDFRNRIHEVELFTGKQLRTALGGSFVPWSDPGIPLPHVAYFVNGANVSNSSSGFFFDCFFPKIPLLDVKPLAYPHIVALDSEFSCIAGTLPAGPKYTYTARYEAPTVVPVDDGNLIEAVKVVVKRDGYAWGDYQFGYRLGLIRFDAAETTKTFFSVPQLAATSLPPPAVEGTVVEYRNMQDFPQSPGGHFFYSSDPAEQASVDAGQAGKFERTGRSFNAGGYLPVCRFYGSVSPGPNSHFFSALPEECALLKSLERAYIAPSGEPQWNSEGNGFYTVAPRTDAQGKKTCLAGTQPVHRAYNNAFPLSGSRNPWDSNHRFSTQRADIDELVQRNGWRDEGIAFCAPLSPASR